MNKTQYLESWLESPLDIPASSNSDRYILRLLRENNNHRSDEVINELRRITQAAHEDAKRRLRHLAGFSLDPLGENQNIEDPTIGYPEKLDIVTLQGYFGEIFAGIVAENYRHFGDDGWEVPAYPFRFHTVAFQMLEQWRQSENPSDAVKVPGRTGDDMLAFLRDQEGSITRSLVCEAKCTRNHEAKLISDAHEKAANPNLKPVDILNLIEILEDYDDCKSKTWVNALRELYYRDASKNYERIDLVAYVCGQPPVRNKSWIPPDKPHQQYTAKRRLEAVEVHLNGVIKLVQDVYGISNNLS